MDGILLVNKNAGITSFFCVNKIKKKFGFKKVGHCGTLDPMAMGLLILVINKATKYSQELMKFNKVYYTELCLGISTNTQDATGEILEEKPYDYIDIKRIKNVFKGFVGEQMQKPPMFSALKVKGKKLYKLARKGIEIQRAARPILIKSIKIDKIDIPRVSFTVEASKGTYIRTLCHDIGEKLETCAYMSKLNRIKIGEFSLDDALDLDTYLLMSYEEIERKIIPIERIFGD